MKRDFNNPASHINVYEVPKNRLLMGLRPRFRWGALTLHRGEVNLRRPGMWPRTDGQTDRQTDRQTGNLSRAML